MRSKIPSPFLPAIFSKRGLAIALLSLLPAIPAQAQSTQGVIVGHVQHKVTQDSLKNAEVAIKGSLAPVLTDTGGDYVLSNIPAGEVTITVTYIGMVTQERRVIVPPGGRVTADFDMAPDNLDIGAGLKPAQTKEEAAKQEVITLDKFVVSGEYEGNARALMEQRNRIGVSQIVATDAFGETANGNVAEFMRYMPGVTFAYNDAEITMISIGGAESEAVGVTIDGVKMASSGGGSGNRAMEWNLFSISAVESIEVDLTGGGDSAAGTVKLKTKGAFDQKGRRISYKVFAVGNTYEPTFRRTPGGDDGYSSKTRPGFEFQYSEAYFHNNVGFSLGLSHIPHYSYTDHLQMSYANATKEYFTQSSQSGTPITPPSISGINYKDGNNFGFADSLYAKIDYKINPFGKMALGLNYSEKKNELWNRGYSFGGLSTSLSTLTHVETNGNAGTLNANYSQATSNKLSDTLGVTFNLDYNFGRLKLEVAAGYTKASTDYHVYDDEAPFFYNFPASISSISYEATRSSPRSTDWQFTWRGGNDWTDPTKWNAGGGDRLITGRNSVSDANVLQATVDLTWTAPVRMPLDLKLTLQGSRDKRFASNSNYYESWNYTPVSPGFADFVSPFKIDPHMGENIKSLNLPYPDRSALYRAYVEYKAIYDAALAEFIANGGKEWNFKLEGYTGPAFTLTKESQYNPLRRELDPGTETLETLAAAIFRLTIQPMPRLDIQANMRYDFTDQQSVVMMPLSKSQMHELNYQDTDADTPEYIRVQLRNGERSTPTNRYAYWLPSAAARYKFTNQLTARVSYSKSIGRIPISRMSGRWSYNDNADVIGGRLATAPNPNLTPDPSNKILAALSYAIKGGGEIATTYSVTSWDGLTNDYIYMNESPDPSTWDMALYNQLVGSFGSENIEKLIAQGYVIRTYDNSARRSRKVEQVTLSYNQPLPFTNRKVNVSASFTRTIPNWLRAGSAYQDRTASGSISYNDRYVYTRLGLTWTDRFRTGNAGEWNETRRPAFLNVNLEATLKISKRFNPYLVMYNLTDEIGFDSLYNYQNRDYINRIDKPGVRFTIGIKGDF